MTGSTRGSFPGAAILELSVAGQKAVPGPATADVIPTALNLAHLAKLVRDAEEHGVPEDAVVIFERAGREGSARVRVTGAAVRVPVRESNLRPAEPTRATLGTAAVTVRPDEEYRRRMERGAHAEGWQEGFDAAARAWQEAGRERLTAPRELPENPYLTDPPSHPAPDGEGALSPAEADLVLPDELVEHRRTGLRGEGMVDEVEGRRDVVAHRIRHPGDEQGSPWHLHASRIGLRQCVIDLQALDGLDLSAMPD